MFESSPAFSRTPVHLSVREACASLRRDHGEQDTALGPVTQGREGRSPRLLMLFCVGHGAACSQSSEHRHGEGCHLETGCNGDRHGPTEPPSRTLPSSAWSLGLSLVGPLRSAAQITVLVG